MYIKWLHGGVSVKNPTPERVHDVLMRVYADARPPVIPWDEQVVVYRRELRTFTPQGELIDRFQEPPETEQWGMGDCEDLSIDLSKSAEEESDALAIPSIVNMEFSLHCVVVTPTDDVITQGRRVWEGSVNDRVYIGRGTWITFKDKKWSLIDPSWRRGMYHPALGGYKPNLPKYWAEPVDGILEYHDDPFSRLKRDPTVAG